MSWFDIWMVQTARKVEKDKQENGKSWIIALKKMLQVLGVVASYQINKEMLWR